MIESIQVITEAHSSLLIANVQNANICATLPNYRFMLQLSRSKNLRVENTFEYLLVQQIVKPTWFRIDYTQFEKRPIGVPWMISRKITQWQLVYYPRSTFKFLVTY